MTTVRWAGPALRDYRNVISWIRAVNPYAAGRLREVVKHRVALLATMPRMGRLGRVPRTRELVMSGTSYLLIYDYSEADDHIDILRMLHGAQRWPPKEP